MSEMKPVAWATALALLGVKNAEDGRRPRAVLLSRECAGGRRIGLILDADHERVVAELREKFDEQVQITARIANENASNRLRAERAEARVAELEADARRTCGVVAYHAADLERCVPILREYGLSAVADECEKAVSELRTAIDQQLAKGGEG